MGVLWCTAGERGTPWCSCSMVVDTQVPERTKEKNLLTRKVPVPARKKWCRNCLAIEPACVRIRWCMFLCYFKGASIFKLQKTGLSDWEQKNSGACVDVACAT